MAVLKPDQLFDIDVSSAQFTQRGVPDTSTGDLIKSLGGFALQAVKGKFIGDARAEGGNLLEKFTRRKELAAIDTRIEDVGVDQQNIREGPAGAGQDPNLSKRQLSTLQEAKNQLKLNRLAVEQGKLTESAFRLRSETLYYKLLAFSPGLREELAKALGEQLGIGDPRGQEAKVELAERKALLAQKDRIQNAQVDQIVKLGLSKPGDTPAQLVHDFNDIASQYVMRKHIIAQSIQEEALGGIINKKAQIENLKRVAGFSLVEMANVEGLNIAKLSIPQIKSMSEEQKQRVRVALEGAKNQLLDLLTKTNIEDPELGKRFEEMINRRAQFLDDILTLKGTEESTQGRLDVLNNENAIMIADSTKGILRERPEIVVLAAFQKQFPVANLFTGLTAQNALLDLLAGAGESYNGQDPLAAARVAHASLKGNEEFYLNNKGNINADDMTSMIRTTMLSANSDAGTLDDSIRQRLFSLVALDGFLDDMSTLDPGSVNKIINGTLKHHIALGTNWQRSFSEIIAQSPLRNFGVTGKDYHIEKSSGGWFVAINPEKVISMNKFKVLPRGRAGGAAAQAGRTEKIKQDIQTVSNSLNKPLGMINNLVKSKAVVRGIGEERAVDEVALQMGLSSELDKSVGFGDTPKLSDAPVLKNKEAPQPQKLDDGVYNINGTLFQIVDGKLTQLEE